jgi:hypothetical protein
MYKIFTVKNVHILSLLAVLSVFLVAAVAEIREHKAYLDLPGHSFEIGRCYYKTNFGFDCPSCGMTRGFISIENFDFKSAFRYNKVSPFVYLMFVFLAIFNILSLRKNKYSALFGKFLVAYSFLTCVAIVIIWIIFYLIPLLN